MTNCTIQTKNIPLETDTDAFFGLTESGTPHLPYNVIKRSGFSSPLPPNLHELKESRFFIDCLLSHERKRALQ